MNLTTTTTTTTNDYDITSYIQYDNLNITQFDDSHIVLHGKIDS
jgi:hypothetical protein